MSSSEKQVQMVNPPGAEHKMVKIRAIHPIRITKDGAEYIVSPKQEAMVTEDEAKEFCDRPFDIGYKQVFGNIDRSTAQKTIIIRAERVK